MKQTHCPECLLPLKEVEYGSGLGGISTNIALICENEDCKFYRIPRLIFQEDFE